MGYWYLHAALATYGLGTRTASSDGVTHYGKKMYSYLVIIMHNDEGAGRKNSSFYASLLTRNIRKLTM
jgi:hypothetical protein